MKKSLEILGIKSSGLEDALLNPGHIKSDDEVFDEASKIGDQKERENLLREALKNKTTGYPKSMFLLADLIKESDPAYACELVYLLCQSLPERSKYYLLFARIAICHKAWFIAKSAIEAASWFSLSDENEVIEGIIKSRKLVLDKILIKEDDASTSDLWKSKLVDKYWILERLYYQGKTKKLIQYAFKLLDKYNNPINHEIVYRALSSLKDKKVFNNFIKCIKENFANDNLNLNLYLGMSYYSLSKFDKSIECMHKALNSDSKNQKALYCLALSYLLKNDLKSFVVTCDRILPASDPAFIAVYFVQCAVLELKLDEIEFPNQKNISIQIKKILENLLEQNSRELVVFLIKQFEKFKYHVIVPSLNLYLSEMFIKEKEFEVAKELLKYSDDNEVHRLYSWIYRLQENEMLAEKELVEYRKNLLPIKDSDRGIHCHLINLDIPDEVPENEQEILTSLTKLYSQTKELTKELDLEYGLNASTCIETGCQDCCTKTFPYLSYTEYLYLRKWLETQSKELQKMIYERSVAVVNLYKEKFGKEPPFMLGDSFDLHKEYPPDFVFECPNLGNNKCNVYEGRPFTCRAYSYASSDGRRYKGCDYFFLQFSSANKLSDVRKVVNMASFFDFAKETDEKLIGTRIIAPIPVWFAQTHEETLEKIKKVIG